MLGWHISVYRQAGDSSVRAIPKREKADRIAVWQTGIAGLDWLNRLVVDGKVAHLGGNSYPHWYTGQARDLLAAIVGGPPEAHDVWSADQHDILGARWEGRTVIDRAAVDLCIPEEWLLVEVWDES